MVLWADPESGSSCVTYEPESSPNPEEIHSLASKCRDVGEGGGGLCVTSPELLGENLPT